MGEFSFTGLLIFVSVSVALIGKKDMPSVARYVGGWVGKSMASMRYHRMKFNELSQSSELSKIHTELQEGLFELNSIRSELIATGSLRNRKSHT